MTQTERKRGGYEDHPTTVLLATHCCLCGHPLVDVTSVEAGIGPICREKVAGCREAGPADLPAVWNLLDEIGDAGLIERTRPHRDDPERLAHTILHYVSLCTGRQIDDPKVLAAACAIRACGYDRLASILLDACCNRTGLLPGGVVLTVERDGYSVQAPYCEAALPAWRAIRYGQFDRGKKANRVRLEDKQALWGLLRRHYGGYVGIVRQAGQPDRYFEIPNVREEAAS